MIPSFGKDGIVDLKDGVVYGNGQQIDLETGEIGLHSTPTVVKDVVIVGSSFREGATVATHNNTKGLVRAFDVRTGKLLWTFNTIPRPGEFGNDTWENDSWAINGNTGVWTQITVDEELGLVYLPVETPTSDFYGGHRPGNNLFAESLVCVDLKTGQRKWHFQLVHHPIWDYDMSSRADPRRHHRRRQARSRPSRVPSKQAFLYVFDRVTGQPVWPIEERPVPQSDVPGEKTSPTQPFPTKPPAYARNYLKVPDDLIDFTPELRAQALEQSEALQDRAVDVHAAGRSATSNGLLGAIDIGNAGGGTNWPGGALRSRDAHRLRAGGQHRRRARSLVAPPPGFSDIRYVAGIGGPAVPRSARARVTAARPMRRARRRDGAPRRRRAGGARPRRAAAAAAPAAGCTVAGPADRRSRRTACSRRSISIAARSCGRCRTATRRTTSAIIRRCKG